MIKQANRNAEVDITRDRSDY